QRRRADPAALRRHDRPRPGARRHRAGACHPDGGPAAVSLVSPGKGDRMEITDDAIRDVVLGAMRNANEARDAASQLVVSAEAPIFGPDSPLDSLGRVGLLLDVEEGLQAIGCDVVLSDERAVSQTRSPFRSVQSLVSYVGTLAREYQDGRPPRADHRDE